jgi:hypothetical protein
MSDDNWGEQGDWNPNQQGQPSSQQSPRQQGGHQQQGGFGQQQGGQPPQGGFGQPQGGQPQQGGFQQDQAQGGPPTPRAGQQAWDANEGASQGTGPQQGGPQQASSWGEPGAGQSEWEQGGGGDFGGGGGDFGGGGGDFGGGGGGLGDGPDVDFDTVFENFKLLLGRSTGNVLLSFVIVVGAIMMFGVVIQGMNVGLMKADLATVAMILGILLIPVNFVLGMFSSAFQFGLFSPMKRLLVEGPGAVDGPIDGIKQSVQKIFPLMGASLVIGVVGFIGMLMCCVPGFLILFFTLPAPYLIATRDDLDFFEAFQEGFELAQRHVVLLLICVAGLIFLFFGIGAMIAISNFALMSVLQEWTPVVQPILIAPIQLLLGYLTTVLWAAVFTSIDAAERGTRIAG